MNCSASPCLTPGFENMTCFGATTVTGFMRRLRTSHLHYELGTGKSENGDGFMEEYYRNSEGHYQPKKITKRKSRKPNR